MSEGSPARIGEQERPRWSPADLLTAARLPLAVAFPLVSAPELRFAILVAAAGTDLLDGRVARRYGASRLGALLDPIADKLFMASAFGVVAFSGRLAWYEVGAALIRDIVATIAFAVTAIRGTPSAIPARPGGKAVTIGQMLTLLAFLLDSPLVRPLAWATAGAGLYAIWDYTRVSGREKRGVAW
ncbi:MAG TPA: CDP-alcohol phosphatidyltransferase family protein [Gemmatimonadales bacterium]|jgi:CDP-diacylglycerol--glycerol-3-phosphate 3-phosphatidyltransferase/cardiolipin synthase|nr:CDP-alcohol phosphatidyltransferase family protein [Gemmatimonadales bacterium]